MQRWSIGIAVIAGLAVVGVLLAMRAQVGGDAASEAKRVSLRPEREPKPGTRNRAAPSPLLVGKDLDVRLRTLRGRPVVLNAWASWCPPCREELPFFANASARFGRRVSFLGADVEDDAGNARRLLAEIPLGYPSYSTSLNALGGLAPAAGTPFTVLIDRNGQVVNSHIGAYRSQGELDTDVSALVGPN